LLVALLLLAQACSAPEPGPDLLAPSEEQIGMRSYQTRVLDSPDKNHVLRAVIVVLQDLGFIIERANDALGVVTAERFAGSGYSTRSVVAVTVTVRERAGDRTEVRVNGVFNSEPIEDPVVYQNFFASLSRSVFLTQE
jgi:hypothetical protein